MIEKRTEGGVTVTKTMSMSEKHRFVVTMGRVKETSTELRKLHGMMQEYYDPVMEPESEFVFALTGDMKYLSSMNGHSGASSTYPCNCCVRSRKGMVSCYCIYLYFLFIRAVLLLGVAVSQFKRFKTDGRQR